MTLSERNNKSRNGLKYPGLTPTSEEMGEGGESQLNGGALDAYIKVINSHGLVKGGGGKETNGTSNGATKTTPPAPLSRSNSLAANLVNAGQSLITKMHKRIAENQTWFSLEFFPPRTVQGAANLISKLENMASGMPLFCDITWHPAGDPSGEKPTSSMKIAAVMANYCLLETMLHITCINQTKEMMKNYLDKAKSLGIRNILALRGDPPVGAEWKYREGYLNYSTDLVRFIREQYGDYFVICVAGYPHSHPDSLSVEDDLARLKEKCDAGADFIITQLFFRPERFLEYVRDCRAHGITIPIVPGILPIQSYDSLKHICKLSKLEVPADIIHALEPIKGNDEAIRNYGIESAVAMCRMLMEAGVLGFHFYTLNREVAVTDILKRLGLWYADTFHRDLPWKVTPVSSAQCRQRESEEVRPIFWASRPKSYVCRTSNWDQFPNGRWGDSSAASYGDLKDYHLFYSYKTTANEALRQCSIESEQDVWRVFELFLSGEPNSNGLKITTFPWCEEEELSPETSLMRDELIRVNRKGVLTINSQPNVNGLPSNDAVLGWGFSDGYVYQKAYLEFFISSDMLPYMLDALLKYPRVNYHILNRSESINLTNCKTQTPNAVTWGVFPGQEIVQPTVVDPVSFFVSKDEVYSIWHDRWGVFYDEHSKARQIIDHMANNYLIVNLVDNDYPKENCLWHLLDDMFELQQQDQQKQQQQVTSATSS